MPPLLQQFFPLALGLFSAGFAVYSLLRKEGKEDRAKREAAEAKVRDDHTNNELKWKQSRLDSEQAIRDHIREVRAELQNMNLLFQGDMARVADILKRTVLVNDQLTTMAEQMRWHGKTMERHDEEFKAVHEELKGLQTDIKNLIRRDPHA